ncbi:hypothetical protein SCD_n00260 [Sulfuricella denitrificans skB26]|uniref:Multi-ubiquitin domain-containing protein n=1 Tax=Sulfuricella denitrificans (strain DSM 22764 / NBRC 105220 / skB26) TaxID=1163617 RepID=S6AHV2_SULDS|nr:multiubiquitin domain-containing protein [Sulfuricella denitrificans]BAN34109.1 hypothetical protein SCD_n00260 [Sulfuricella denitrificans skB26]
MNTSVHESKQQKHAVHIKIDEVQYVLPSNEATGAELRALVPVPGDRDLWLDVHGPKDDILIRPESNYDVKSGSDFYTAPSTINPGGM